MLISDEKKNCIILETSQYKKKYANDAHMQLTRM